MLGDVITLKEAIKIVDRWLQEKPNHRTLIYSYSEEVERPEGFYAIFDSKGDTLEDTLIDFAKMIKESK